MIIHYYKQLAQEVVGVVTRNTINTVFKFKQVVDVFGAVFEQIANMLGVEHDTIPLAQMGKLFLILLH